MNKYHPSAIEVGQIYFDHHSETNGTFECGELIVQAADRAIQNAKSDWQPIETAPYAARQQIRLGEAQGARANNISVSADRMRQALLSIANSQCCDTCNEAKKVARDALGMPYD